MNEVAPRPEAAQPTVAPAITHLSASWQDWLTTNVVRGCADADMIKVMVSNGFYPAFSSHAVSIVRSMAERVKGEVAALGNEYKAGPIRLPKDARVRAHDRDVQIV